MTNREWLNKMALIDMLYWFVESNKYGICFLSGKEFERCDDFENCYNCIAAWLNEENKGGIR